MTENSLLGERKKGDLAIRAAERGSPEAVRAYMGMLREETDGDWRGVEHELLGEAYANQARVLQTAAHDIFALTGFKASTDIRAARVGVSDSMVVDQEGVLYTSKGYGYQPRKLIASVFNRIPQEKFEYTLPALQSYQVQRFQLPDEENGNQQQPEDACFQPYLNQPGDAVMYVEHLELGTGGSRFVSYERQKTPVACREGNDWQVVPEAAEKYFLHVNSLGMYEIYQRVKVCPFGSRGNYLVGQDGTFYTLVEHPDSAFRDSPLFVGKAQGRCYGFEDALENRAHAKAFIGCDLELVSPAHGAYKSAGKYLPEKAMQDLWNELYAPKTENSGSEPVNPEQALVKEA